MNPEVVEELDAARAALTLIDAALAGEGGAAWFIAEDWSQRGEVLLRQLLAVTETLTRRVGELTNADPHQIIQKMRNDVAAAEAVANERERNHE